jgi:hypothetical protein
MAEEMPRGESDPIADIIGDYRAFAAMQRDRLLARGIDISPYALSHLAVRVADWDRRRRQAGGGVEPWNRFGTHA